MITLSSEWPHLQMVVCKNPIVYEDIYLSISLSGN